MTSAPRRATCGPPPRTPATPTQSDAVGELAGALPGSSTASVMPELAIAWDEGITAWASSVGDFADGLDAAAADAEAADARAQAFQEWLRTFLGGGS